MQDIVHYALKFGLLGQMMPNMVIAQSEIFDYRKAAPKKYLSPDFDPD